MADGERQRRFDALLREHQRLVFKVAAVYARSAEERADLEQDIALQAWRSFAAFDPARAKFSTWLYRVALNVAISRVRDVQRTVPSEPLTAVHADTIAGGAPAQAERLQGDARVAALYRFIAGLDALNRALVLLYLEDRSYAEIAEVLGISETNVATRLNRIKQKLRAAAAAADPQEEQHGTR